MEVLVSSRKDEFFHAVAKSLSHLAVAGSAAGVTAETAFFIVVVSTADVWLCALFSRVSGCRLSALVALDDVLLSLAPLLPRALIFDSFLAGVTMLLFSASCGCDDDSVNWLADGTTLCGLWMLVVVLAVDADFGDAGAFDIAADDFYSPCRVVPDCWWHWCLETLPICLPQSFARYWPDPE